MGKLGYTSVFCITEGKSIYQLKRSGPTITLYRNRGLYSACLTVSVTLSL